MLRSDHVAAWAIADSVLATRDPATRDDPSRPYHQRWVWDGRALDGEDVLVRCYHGLGDTLQFARFLPHLRARVRHVTLEVQPELTGLLAGFADRVTPFDVTAPVDAACDIEIMELPHALRLMPDPAPYLVPPLGPPGKASPVGAGAGLIGVCWQAGDWDQARSIPLHQLRRVLPANVVSLQRGAVVSSADNLRDPLDGDIDLTATAHLVATLDHIVTVDTMIAHLAGALGRPVSLLLRHDADWRWGLADDTPWYRSTRLFRQHAPGDWSRALQQLQRALPPA